MICMIFYASVLFSTPVVLFNISAQFSGTPLFSSMQIILFFCVYNVPVLFIYGLFSGHI